MSKHTPGPWLHRGKSDSVHRPPPANSGYQFGDLVFRFHEDEPPCDADLTLILAAPSLLAALRWLLSRAERELADPEDVPEVAEARAAIGKATGADHDHG